MDVKHIVERETVLLEVYHFMGIKIYLEKLVQLNKLIQILKLFSLFTKSKMIYHWPIKTSKSKGRNLV